MPALVRWPGHIPAGTNITGICSHLDWLPTLLAAAGEPEIKEKLLTGYQVGSKTFKIHLDGYNMLDYLTGKTDKSPRRELFYFSDDGDLVGLRYDNWKFVFKEQREQGTCQIWAEPFVELACPRSSTCSLIPTSGPTSPPTPTGTGCSITCSCLCRLRLTWVISSRPSWSSRHARRQPASPWSG